MSRRAAPGSAARVGAGMAGSSEPQRDRRADAQRRRRWAERVLQQGLGRELEPVTEGVLREARRAQWEGMVAPAALEPQIALQLRNACTFMHDVPPWVNPDEEGDATSGPRNLNACTVYLPHPTLPVVLEGRLRARTERSGDGAAQDYSHFVNCWRQPLYGSSEFYRVRGSGDDVCTFKTDLVHWRSGDEPIRGLDVDLFVLAAVDEYAAERVAQLGGVAALAAYPEPIEFLADEPPTTQGCLRALQRGPQLRATPAAFADARTPENYADSARPHAWQSAAPRAVPVWLTPEGGGEADRVPFPLLLTQLGGTDWMDSIGTHMRVRASDFTQAGQNVFFGSPSSDRVAYLTDRKPWIRGLGLADFRAGAADVAAAVAVRERLNVYTTWFPRTDAHAPAQPEPVPATPADLDRAHRAYQAAGHRDRGEMLHGQAKAGYRPAYERLAEAAALDRDAAALKLGRVPRDRMLDFVLKPELYRDAAAGAAAGAAV
jgi:hypothetical protein